MKTLLIIVSILLISIVLLQSGKAEGGSFLNNTDSKLFVNRKERGGELFITRLTLALGIIFFAICVIMNF